MVNVPAEVVSKGIQRHFENRLADAARLLVDVYSLKTLRDLRESLGACEQCDEIKARIAKEITQRAATLCIPPGGIQDAVNGAWHLIEAADDTINKLLKIRLPRS